MGAGNCGNGAIISGDYRYLLWRIWDAGPRLLWVMLNPSRADAEHDDLTLATCRRFSEGWGYGGLEIVNLFAYRTPYVRELFAADKPIGRENDRYLEEAAKRSTTIVVAWGEHGDYQGRDHIVLNTLRRHAMQPLQCLGTVQNGCPCHPARKPRTTGLRPYS